MTTAPVPVRRFRVDALDVAIFENRAELGRAAAADAAAAIAARVSQRGEARVVFAAAPSQDDLLAALAMRDEIDWGRVRAFHMDEYCGLDANHPASFRRYLHEHLFDVVGLRGDRLELIPGERVERPSRVCAEYEDRLLAAPLDLVCAGIGENGHLAFNDPPVADFLDPVLVKVVRLDADCRGQQVHDGCFASLDDVPTHAYTLTIPALLSAPRLVVCVPGARKAQAVFRTLRDRIDEHCPATVLRTHEGARLYLDRDSAELLIDQ